MNQDKEKPTLDLSLSPDDFDQATWQSTADRLEPYFRVGGGIDRVDLSDVTPIPHIVCVIGDIPKDVAVGLISAALWDALKPLLRPRETSKSILVEFIIKVGSLRVAYRKVTTDEPEVLKRCVEQVAGDTKEAIAEDEDE